MSSNEIADFLAQREKIRAFLHKRESALAEKYLKKIREKGKVLDFLVNRCGRCFESFMVRLMDGFGMSLDSELPDWQVESVDDVLTAIKEVFGEDVVVGYSLDRRMYDSYDEYGMPDGPAIIHVTFGLYYYCASPISKFAYFRRDSLAYLNNYEEMLIDRYFTPHPQR